MNPQDVKRDYEVSAVQRIPSISLKFDWTIENYNVEKRDGCKSPEIDLPDVKLGFLLQRFPDLSPNRVNYEMLRVRSNSLSIYLSGKIVINGTKYSFSRKITAKDELILKILEIISPGEVEIVFDLRLYYLAKKNSIFTKRKYETKLDGDRYSQQLHDYVQSLWQNPIFSDVRIDVGSESIPAHKNILSARSPVFERMFQNLNVENTENVVNVMDVSYDAMERLVGFLYGHSPDLDSIQDADALCNLYFASDKYQVLYLRNMCGLALLDRMTPGTACELIDLFGRHADSEMAKLVINTCCMHLSATSETDEWRVEILANPKLTALVLGKLTEAQ